MFNLSLHWLRCQGVFSCFAHGPLQGTASAEVQAARAAGDAARGGTAYLNLETGDCHGDATATAALLSAGVSRVVVGLPHPLEQQRGAATGCLRANGVAVDVLGVSHAAAEPVTVQAALEACLTANEVGRALQQHASLYGRVPKLVGHQRICRQPRVMFPRVFQSSMRYTAKPRETRAGLGAVLGMPSIERHSFVM